MVLCHGKIFLFPTELSLWEKNILLYFQCTQCSKNSFDLKTFSILFWFFRDILTYLFYNILYFFKCFYSHLQQTYSFIFIRIFKHDNLNEHKTCILIIYYFYLILILFLNYLFSFCFLFSFLIFTIIVFFFLILVLKNEFFTQMFKKIIKD